MVESKINTNAKAGNKMQTLLPAEIANRFSSKEDFLKYFREQL